MNKVNEAIDSFGRRLKYLRISVTDRCNFRCKYCMPNNDFHMLECDDILRYEDILFAAEVFSKLGVNRIRVTGGEPLVRKGIIEFLSKLTKIANINEVMVTTNGSLLYKYAQDLYNAGVKRLNISLDSLKPERNKYITGFDKTDDILKGIELASSIGIRPVKVNSVIIRDFNDDEIEDFANLAAINSGPAVNYKLNNGGIVGIITPISNHFCSDCDKLRLTSDGKIRPCLLSDKEIDIKDVLKKRDEDMLINMIMESLDSKKDKHSVTDTEQKYDFKRTMSKIGG